MCIRACALIFFRSETKRSIVVLLRDCYGTAAAGFSHYCTIYLFCPFTLYHSGGKTTVTVVWVGYLDNKDHASETMSWRSTLMPTREYSRAIRGAWANRSRSRLNFAVDAQRTEELIFRKR